MYSENQGEVTGEVHVPGEQGEYGFDYPREGHNFSLLR